MRTRTAAVILAGGLAAASGSAALGCGEAFVAGSTGGSTSTSSSSSSSSASSGSSSGSTPSSSTSSSSSSGNANSCDASHPCPMGRYCSSPSCDGTGTCVVILASPSAYAPKCGCDKATYWNGAVAAGANQLVRHDGACMGSEATPCSSATPSACTGVNGSCNLAEQGTTCLPLNTGTCWVVPMPCDNTDGAGMACGSTTCSRVCDLITMQVPYVVSNCTPN